MAEIKIAVCGMVENILGKGNNAGFRHCFLYPIYFQEPSSLGSAVPSSQTSNLTALCDQETQYIYIFYHYTAIAVTVR